MSRSIRLLLAGGLLFAFAAQAESLKEKKAKKAAEKKLTGDEVKDANKTCGSKVKLKIDWKSFKGKLDERHDVAVAANYCVSVADGLRYACKDEFGQAAASSSIKSITCAFDADATREKLDRYGPSLSLKKKTLKAGFNWETGNIADEVGKYVRNELKAKGKKHSPQALIEIRDAEKVLAGDPLESANKACGAKVKAKLDWGSFEGKFKGSHARASAAHYCNGVIDGIRYVCKDDLGKEAVSGAIKSLTCKFDASITKDKIGRYGPELKLKKGKLTATYGWDTGNMSDGTKEWLLNNL